MRSLTIAAPRNVRGSVVALAVVSLVTYVVVRVLLDTSMIDFLVYRFEGGALLHSRDLYGDLGAPQGLRATYPPFAALAFVPFSVISPLVGQVLCNIGNVVLVGVVAWQSCRLVGVPARRQLEATVVLASLALWAEPVFTSLGNGQVNLAVLALVLSDFTRQEGDRRRGIGIGLAAGLKVTPLIFIGYLLLTKRFRAAAVAAVTFAGTLAASVAVAPAETWRYWTQYLFDTRRVGDLVNSTNQSLPGLISRLARVDEPGLGLSIAGILVTLVILGAAARVYGRLGDSWGVAVCAVGTLLGSPISWTHHWVWCVPISALLCQARSRLWPVTIVFWSFVPFFAPHAPSSVLHYPLWKIALTGSYVVFGIVLVVTAVRRPRRDRDVGRAMALSAGS